MWFYLSRSFSPFLPSPKSACTIWCFLLILYHACFLLAPTHSCAWQRLYCGRIYNVSHIWMNSVPQVQKSPGMSCEHQKATLMKKYHMFRCCILLLLDVLPLWANRIVLLLSWYIVVVGTYIPCTARKCLVHRTCAIASSIATSLAAVELLVFNFCLLDALYVAPLANVINIPLLLFL